MMFQCHLIKPPGSVTPLRAAALRLLVLVSLRPGCTEGSGGQLPPPGLAMGGGGARLSSPTQGPSSPVARRRPFDWGVRPGATISPPVVPLTIPAVRIPATGTELNVYLVPDLMARLPRWHGYDTERAFDERPRGPISAPRRVPGSRA